MKRLLTITIASLTLVCFGADGVYAQSQELSKKEKKELEKKEKKEQKERKKKIAQIGSAIEFKKAAEYIKSGNFVIEASTVQNNKGRIANVASNTNFISVINGESVVQIAPSSHISGPNGVGGITVDGKVSNVEISENKNGTLTYSYSVQGIGISATVKIQLPKDSTEARATVYPNFHSNEITLQGRVVSPQNSKVFKGRAL